MRLSPRVFLFRVISSLLILSFDFTHFLLVFLELLLLYLLFQDLLLNLLEVHLLLLEEVIV